MSEMSAAQYIDHGHTQTVSLLTEVATLTTQMIGWANATSAITTDQVRLLEKVGQAVVEATMGLGLDEADG